MVHQELPQTPIELRYPGSFLTVADAKKEPEKYMRLQGLLSHLETLLNEAAMALVFFQQGHVISAEANSKGVWQRRRDENAERHRELSDEFDKKRGWPPPAATAQSDEERKRLMEEEWEQRNEISVIAGRQLHREAWAVGELPRMVTHMAPFVGARGFLYCADMIGKTLAALGEELSQIVPISTAFAAEFPTLVDVRDSVQHAEDRMRLRGKPRYGKPTALPNPNTSGGRLLIIDNLSGDHFGTTTADGHHTEVEISPRVLARLRDYVQSAIDALPWSGPARFAPGL